MSLLAILGVRLWDVMCVMFAEPSGRWRNDSPRQTSGMVGNSAKGDDEMNYVHEVNDLMNRMDKIRKELHNTFALVVWNHTTKDHPGEIPTQKILNL